MAGFYRPLSPELSQTKIHAASGQIPKNLRFSRENPLTPISREKGESEDNRTSQWLDESAATKAASIRHGADDWDLKRGDGGRAKQPASQDKGKPPGSPDFVMPGMDGIMAKARDLKGKPAAPGPRDPGRKGKKAER